MTDCLEKRFKLGKMTQIQEKSIPSILNGKDCFIKSQTGSGKTLAYAIPIIQSLQAREPKIKRSDGIRALVLVPTRELATQTCQVFEQLCNVSLNSKITRLAIIFNLLIIFFFIKGMYLDRSWFINWWHEKEIGKRSHTTWFKYFNSHARTFMWSFRYNDCSWFVKNWVLNIWRSWQVDFETN